MPRLGVDELVATILDPGSIEPWHFDVPDTGVVQPYRAELEEARKTTGRRESVISCCGTVNGRRVAVIAGDPGFLGGSISVSAGERLTRAIERATAERLPLIALPVGGGTRMQEGTVAFLQMVKIAGAVMAHKEARLPYLVYLRHPTMGGVFASWGSLGHVTVAEPGALVGFLGPRVFEALYGERFPEGVQLSDNLAERGVIDAVCEPEELPSYLDRLLNVVAERPIVGSVTPAGNPHLPDVPAWESVLRTRLPDRPGIRELLQHAARHVTMLNGTGDGESHPGSVLALVRWGDAPCVVVGQDRHDQNRPLDPAALREVRRGIRLARELNLPLLSVIDTPGAALSKEAEERGLASEIARTLSELITLPTATVSLLMGQGTGGIALALMPADVVVASQHAWLAPLPPEGASAIVHRTVECAPEMATAQGIRAADLLGAGIVDRVVLEPDDPGAERRQFCLSLGDALRDEIQRVVSMDDAERRERRRLRFRTLGLG